MRKVALRKPGCPTVRLAIAEARNRQQEGRGPCSAIAAKRNLLRRAKTASFARPAKAVGPKSAVASYASVATRAPDTRGRWRIQGGPAANPVHRTELRDLYAVFGRIGLLSFGGPAAQISLMHKELVEERDWLTEEEFLRALSLCMLLPGPEAMQLATYAGWRLRGTLGGLIAGLLFVLPGACVILALALVYAHLGQVPVVQAAFDGIKAAVIIIVLLALRSVSSRTLRSPRDWILAGGAFAALFLFAIPFPLIILTAAVIGAALTGTGGKNPTPVREIARAPIWPTVVLWGGLWAAPLAVVALVKEDFLLQIGLFFSKLAVVTFGGAYAVLAYMTQTVVIDYNWITTAEMIDALGLAETTPGPLILVTQFVAMLAGFAEGGIAMALLAGLLALWVTFTPCFLWIFLAGPYLELISSRPLVEAALKAITAAVVGVILNLALWFAVHVMFDRMLPSGLLAMPLPDFGSLKGDTLTLSFLAVLLLIGMKRNIAETLGILAAAGILLSLIW